jgi:hypothetical protein
VNIFDKDGNALWPTTLFDEQYQSRLASYIHPDRRAAIEQAILAAIKLLPNDQ